MMITVTGHEGHEWQLEIELSAAEHAALTARLEVLTGHKVTLDPFIMGTVTALDDKK